MSMIRLSHFPDLPLLAIFGHIPLRDVILTVGAVCKNWSRLQKDELSRRRIVNFYQPNLHSELFYTNLQKSANLFGSELIEQVRRDDGSPWARVQSKSQIKHSLLRMPGHAEVLFTIRLMQNLPRITHLRVMLHNVNCSVSSVVGQMIRLLEHHAINLVGLKIDFLIYYAEEPTEREITEIESNVLALLDCINLLDTLRHLTLKMHNIDMKKMSHRIRMPILSRLSTFSTTEKWLSFSMLAQYAKEGNVQFNCGRICSLDELLLANLQLAKKFVRVIVRDRITENGYERVQLLCVRFSSLITLRLKLATMPMTMLARCLSQLTQLIYLDLNIISRPTDEQPLQLVISQVPSVRLLKLTIHTESHLDTENLHLAEIFPNLQVLYLIHSSAKCSECDLDSRNLKDEPERRPLFVHCMRQSRQPFRRCAKLHTVKLSARGPNWEHFTSLLPRGLITVDQL